MNAHLSPALFIGQKLPELAQPLSESKFHRVLVLGNLATQRPDVVAMCQALDIELINVSSHHELPFRLHHNRPLAVLADLPPDSLAMSATLRCVAAYDAELPVLLLGRDAAATLGTIDAAEQLWGLSNLSREAPDAPPRVMINFLFQAGRQRCALRLLPVG